MAGKRTIKVRGGTLIWDDGAVGIMLRGQQGETGKEIQRRAYAVQKRMKRLAPKWSGELQSGIRVESIGDAPDGPASRIVSDADHTIVAEVGRGPVRASGSYAFGAALRTRPNSGVSAKGVLRWGSDRKALGLGRPPQLTIRLTPGGSVIHRATARAAAGSHFMERSIDAAND